MNAYRYYVYDKDGNKVFDSSSMRDAKLWLGGGNYMVRKDLLGKQPDKIYKAQ